MQLTSYIRIVLFRGYNCQKPVANRGQKICGVRVVSPSCIIQMIHKAFPKETPGDDIGFREVIEVDELLEDDYWGQHQGHILTARQWLINMVTIQKSWINTYMPLTIYNIYFSHVPWFDTKWPFQCDHCFIIYQIVHFNQPLQWAQIAAHITIINTMMLMPLYLKSPGHQQTCNLLHILGLFCFMGTIVKNLCQSNVEQNNSVQQIKKFIYIYIYTHTYIYEEVPFSFVIHGPDARF